MVRLVHPYLHQKYITSCSLGLIWLPSSPHLTRKCSQSSHYHLAYIGPSPNYFFPLHEMSYKLLQTFLFSAPKCITLIFHLLILFLQYFKSTSISLLSNRKLAIAFSHFALCLIASVFCIY